MTAQLKSHSQGQTLVLTLSNPEHRNALDPAMYSAGVEALNVAETNPDVRSVILTGEGKHFCAGGNLNRILNNRSAPPEEQASGIDALHSWIEAIRTFPKPVIAAVEGAAAGAGFSLINHISPTGQALTQALALADKLNQRAPNALASIKELTESAYGQDVFAHMHTEKQHFLKNLNHANAAIGIQAFLDKQTPHYKP